MIFNGFQNTASKSSIRVFSDDLTERKNRLDVQLGKPNPIVKLRCVHKPWLTRTGLAPIPSIEQRRFPGHGGSTASNTNNLVRNLALRHVMEPVGPILLGVWGESSAPTRRGGSGSDSQKLSKMFNSGVIARRIRVNPFTASIHHSPPPHESTGPVFGQGVFLKVGNGAGRHHGESRVIHPHRFSIGLGPLNGMAVPKIREQSLDGFKVATLGRGQKSAKLRDWDTLARASCKRVNQTLRGTWKITHQRTRSLKEQIATDTERTRFLILTASAHQKGEHIGPELTGIVHPIVERTSATQNGESNAQMVAERTGGLFDSMDNIVANEARGRDSMDSISFSKHGGISWREVMGVCSTVVASVLSFDKGSTPNGLEASFSSPAHDTLTTIKWSKSCLN